MLYLASDGYADQLGGPRRKKFSPKTLKTLLTNVAALSPAQQRAMLAESLEQWRGDVAQIDDVTILGIRVS